MRIVFDLDDTICRTENRDYVNSSEISAVVSKIAELRETLPGAQIVVHTSRGMASCNGNVEAAEQKNRPTIEQWLADHGVEVDEIIFGKPLADLYVDDKGMSAEEFAHAKIRRYYGFSGAYVTRIGRVMIKEADNTAEQAEWYRAAQVHYEAQRERLHNVGVGKIRVPKIHSLTLGKLYMEFIPGLSGVKGVCRQVISELTEMLAAEPTLQGENDLNAYADYIEQRAAAIGLRTDIGNRIRRNLGLRARSFCHGDFSLQNIICTKDGYALIDPSPKPGMESWILDAGKLRASLTCLDEVLARQKHDKMLVDVLDERLAFVLPSVLLAEESHIIRVWYYAKKLGKRAQEQQLATIYRERYGER